MRVVLAIALMVTSQIALAKTTSSDVTNVQSVAVQMDIKGETAKKLISYLDQVGVKPTNSRYDIRNMTVRGYLDLYSANKLKGLTFFSIVAVDHAGDYSSRQVLNVDEHKPGTQALGNLLYSLGGRKFADNESSARMGFNVPWISCYGGADFGGPSCQVTIATTLQIDSDVAVGGQ